MYYFSFLNTELPFKIRRVLQMSQQHYSKLYVFDTSKKTIFDFHGMVFKAQEKTVQTDFEIIIKFKSYLLQIK